MEGSDSNHRERWKRTVARNQKVLKRKGKEESRCSKTKEDAEEANKMMEESTDEYENVDDAIADPDVRGASWYQEQFERRNKNSKPDTVILEIPRRNLAKVLSPSASRMKLSVRQSLVCASDMIRVGKGKVSNFAISKTTFQRQRKAGEAELAAKLMSMFLNNPNLKYIVVHWDGKKVKYMDGKIEERIVLILQVVNSGMPPQFVGAPMVATASGKNMKDVIVQYLSKYGLADESLTGIKVIGMGFDTTASNTGHLNGAAALLENELKKALIWFGCRHHVAELHIGWADDAVRAQAAPGGADTMFKKFANYFDVLDLNNLSMWEGNEADQPAGATCVTWFTHQAIVVKEFAQELNESEEWIREDYQELNELLIIYFGGTVRRSGGNRDPYDHAWTMKRPGAVSHARFIAKAIYLIKINMTSHQLPMHVLTADQKFLVERVSKFVLFIYGKYFLQSMIPSSAPHLDLEFWESVYHFSADDPDLVLSVLQSIYRHMWYLSS